MTTTERDEWEGRGECWRCGAPHSYTDHIVEQSVTVGSNTVIVTVQAHECKVCGERSYDEKNANKLTAACHRLENGETAGFRVVGVVYHA